MPSSVVGGAVLRKAALNCSPWVRSLIQMPEAWMNSPALIGGRGTDHRDQVALTAHLDPQHAKAVVGVVEGHPLDQAGERLTLDQWGCAHPGRMRSSRLDTSSFAHSGGPAAPRRSSRSTLPDMARSAELTMSKGYIRFPLHACWAWRMSPSQ